MYYRYNTGNNKHNSSLISSKYPAFNFQKQTCYYSISNKCILNKRKNSLPNLLKHAFLHIGLVVEVGFSNYL